MSTSSLDLTNIDAAKTEMFNEYSSFWWNKKLLGLQRANDLIFEHIVEVVKKRGLKNDVKVLDVGCGGGFLTELMARHGFSVVGIDVNERVIEVARNHANPQPYNLTYRVETVEDHVKENPEHYDVVVLNFVLTHVKHHAMMLEGCVKGLKPGGLIFVTAAAKTYRSWMNVIILPELVFGYIPRNCHNWNDFIDAAEVERILKDNNCVVDDSKGMFYNPFKKYWYWHDHVDRGFYSLYATKQKESET